VQAILLYYVSTERKRNNYLKPNPKQKMKNLLLALVITLSLTTGISTVYSNNTTATEQSASGYSYVKVVQDGAIWVYVYTEDGTFVTKWMETAY